MNLGADQIRYLILAFGGGAFGILALGLVCWSLWKGPSRRPATEIHQPGTPHPEAVGGVRAALRYVPWIVILTIISSFVFSTYFTILKSIRPPNW